MVDPRFGVATSLTGPNSLTTTWTLDDFGRKILETRADGNKTAISYCVISGLGLDTSANSSDCGSLPSVTAPTDAVSFVHTVPKNSSNSQNGAFVRVYHDKLGREIRSVSQSYDGNSQTSRHIAKDTIYNAWGAAIETTQPYFMDTGSSLASGSTPAGGSKTSYDVLGRPTAVLVADPEGSQSSVSFAKGSSNATQFTGNLKLEQGVVVHAIIGGTASVLGGGKLANGAVTGAFSYTFNNCQKGCPGDDRSAAQSAAASDADSTGSKTVEFFKGIGQGLRSYGKGLFYDLPNHALQRNGAFGLENQILAIDAEQAVINAAKIIADNPKQALEIACLSCMNLTPAQQINLQARSGARLAAGGAVSFFSAGVGAAASVGAIAGNLANAGVNVSDQGAVLRVILFGD